MFVFKLHHIMLHVYKNYIHLMYQTIYFDTLYVIISKLIYILLCFVNISLCHCNVYIKPTLSGEICYDDVKPILVFYIEGDVSGGGMYVLPSPSGEIIQDMHFLVIFLD